MTPISCERAEDLLAAATPDRAAHALAGDPPDELHAHLAACEDCAELASGIAELSALLPAAGPSAELRERSLSVAAAELRALSRARRRATRAAAFKALAGFVVAFPLVLALHAAFAMALITWVAPLLPEPVRLYGSVVLVALSLAGLSAVTFLLTLLAGAAAVPPRRKPLEA